MRTRRHDVADPESLEKHLLAALVPEVFRRGIASADGRPVSRTGPEDAQRWLTFLARSLPPEGLRQISWWKIPDLAPMRCLALFARASGAGGGLVFGVIAGCLPISRSALWVISTELTAAATAGGSFWISISSPVSTSNNPRGSKNAMWANSTRTWSCEICVRRSMAARRTLAATHTTLKAGAAEQLKTPQGDYRETLEAIAGMVRRLEAANWNLKERLRETDEELSKDPSFLGHAERLNARARAFLREQGMPDCFGVAFSHWTPEEWEPHEEQQATRFPRCWPPLHIYLRSYRGVQDDDPADLAAQIVCTAYHLRRSVNDDARMWNAFELGELAKQSFIYAEEDGRRNKPRPARGAMWAEQGRYLSDAESKDEAWKAIPERKKEADAGANRMSGEWLVYRKAPEVYAYVPGQPPGCANSRLACAAGTWTCLPDEDPTGLQIVERDGTRFLERRPDGACVHLGPSGCTVHGRRPLACRIFDCRTMFFAGISPGRDGPLVDAILSWRTGKSKPARTKVLLTAIRLALCKLRGEKEDATAEELSTQAVLQHEAQWEGAEKIISAVEQLPAAQRDEMLKQLQTAVASRPRITTKEEVTP